MSDCKPSSHTSSLSAPFAAAVRLPDSLRFRLCELGRRILPACMAQIPPPPLPMLPLLPTQPMVAMVATQGMVVTTLAVVVPLLAVAADIAAVPT